MIGTVSLLCVFICAASSIPLYGSNGGYSGYASYVPIKSNHQNTVSGSNDRLEDSIHAEAGSPDISRRPAKNYVPPVSNAKDITPNHHEIPDYKPAYQHGYGGNGLGHDSLHAPAPYAKPTIYGQESGAYKLSDAYQNQNAQLHTDKNHDYKDDYISNPQPYEYGYALKDEYGNTQHKKESSDGHGKVEGSYGFTDEHGLYRSVQYVADKEGFRASIKTNEPGTDNQDPADVQLESNQQKY